jgi:ParB family transcriptional regulator, chromosome partitioning protein
MSETASTHNVIGLQERPLGGTVLRTYRRRVDIDDIVPNDQQPRLGSKEDEELQRQIEANEGLFEPLLVEPHPAIAGKFRIIDGERRWTNSRILVSAGKEQYRQVPVEITDRTLTNDERLRVWIYIHRQRKEWDAKEKEMVAYSLVQMMGRASTANILGITIRELDKLVAIFEVSEKFTNLRDPATAITWARELMSLSKNLLTPDITSAVISKVAQKRITNSKDLRKLRTILRDPVAKKHFLGNDGNIDSALLRVPVSFSAKHKTGVVSEFISAIEALKGMSWTEVSALKGDAELIVRVAEAQTLLDGLKRSISQS